MASPGGQEVGRVSIRVLPDVSDFRRRLRGDLESATAGLEARVRIDLDLDTAGVRARMAALMAQLRAEASNDIDVNVRLNRRGLGGLGSLAGSADKASGSFRGLSSNTFVLLAALTLVGPAVTLIGGLLAGLPSLAVAAGAAIGVIALGFDGIKKAAAQLGPPIEALKQSLSATFEKRLTPQFAKLAGFLPALKYGFTDIANGLSDISGAFIDTITSGKGFVQITETLRNSGKLFSNLAPFTRSMTEAFLTLASAGSGAFGYLSRSMNRFSDGFNRVVTGLAADGSIGRAMKGLSQVLDGLGDAFNTIFDSAVRNMPKLGEGLKIALQQFGIGLAEAMPGLVALGNVIFATVGFASRVLGGFFKGIGPALTRFADGMLSSLERGGDAVSGFFEKVGAKFGEFLDWLREKTPVILDFVRDFVAAVSGDPIDNGSNGTKIGTALRDGFELVRKFFEDHGEDIAKAITGLVTGFGTVAGFVATMAGAIGTAKTKIQEFVTMVTNFTVGNITSFIRGVGDAFNWVKTKVGEAITAVSEFPGKVLGFLRSAGQNIVTAITDAWNSAVAKVREKVQQAAQAAGELGGKIKSALAGLPGEMVGIGGNIIRGLINGIKSMAGSVASAAAGVVKGAIAAAKGALGIHSPSRVFADFGQLSAVGYINGLEGEGKNVENAGDAFGDRVKKSLTNQVPTIDQAWSQALADSKLGEVPSKFMELAGNELLSDIGIKTDGALGELVKQITEHNNNSTTNYYVTDLDEAQRKEKVKQQKESLQYTKR